MYSTYINPRRMFKHTVFYFPNSLQNLSKGVICVLYCTLYCRFLYINRHFHLFLLVQIRPVIKKPNPTYIQAKK
jgi:hypothetical protein